MQSIKVYSLMLGMLTIFLNMHYILIKSQFPEYMLIYLITKIYIYFFINIYFLTLLKYILYSNEKISLQSTSDLYSSEII